jgi:hypothetical protein
VVTSSGTLNPNTIFSGAEFGPSVQSILLQADQNHTLNTYDLKNLESDLNTKVVTDEQWVTSRFRAYQWHTSPQAIRNFVQSLQSKKFDTIKLQSGTELSPFAPTCCSAYGEIDFIPLKNGIVIFTLGGNGALMYNVDYLAVNDSEIINISGTLHLGFESAVLTATPVSWELKALYDYKNVNSSGSKAVTNGIDMEKVDMKSWFQWKAPTDLEQLKAYTALRADWDRNIELYKKIDQQIGTIKNRNEYTVATYNLTKLDSDLKSRCSEVDMKSCEDTYAGNPNEEQVKKFISTLTSQKFTEAAELIRTTHVNNKKNTTNIILSPFWEKWCCVSYNLVDAIPLKNWLLVLKSQWASDGWGYSIDYLSMSGTTLQNIAVWSREWNNGHYSSSRYLLQSWSGTDSYKNYIMYDIQGQDLRGFKAISPILPIDEDQIQDWFQWKAPTDPELLKAYILLRAEWDRDIELYKKIDATR